MSKYETINNLNHNDSIVFLETEVRRIIEEEMLSVDDYKTICEILLNNKDLKCEEKEFIENFGRQKGKLLYKKISESFKYYTFSTIRKSQL